MPYFKYVTFIKLIFLCGFEVHNNLIIYIDKFWVKCVAHVVWNSFTQEYMLRIFSNVSMCPTFPMMLISSNLNHQPCQAILVHSDGASMPYRTAPF